MYKISVKVIVNVNPYVKAYKTTMYRHHSERLYII